MQTLEEALKKNSELEQEVAFLKEELAQFKRYFLGSKKERFIPSDTAQQSLFDQEVETVESTTETVTYQREKSTTNNKPKRLLLPAHLHREEEVIEPDNLTDQSNKIGEKVTEVLEYTPGKLYVRKIVRPVYKQEDTFKIAELPTQIIPKGNVGVSLLAYLLVSKFIDHLPFYRQVQIFKRAGVKIPESTITGWFRKTCELLEPLYEEMLSRIRSSSYLQADETPIPVLSKDKPGSTHKGYQWVYHLPQEQMVIFKYDSSRGQSVPTAMLDEFSGCLQTDGYAGYNEIAKRNDIIHIACMAHARRKFEVAQDNDAERSVYALTQIQKLYALERRFQEEELSVDQIKDQRQEKAVPILDELKKWLEDQYTQVLPRSSMGKAISYSLKLWPQLCAYTQNGEWYIDNNRVENKIRPLALGRKNYLFAGSHQGAQQAAMMYSFFGTCKMNGIEPLEWLTDTLRKLPDTKLDQLHTLLPIKQT